MLQCKFKAPGEDWQDIFEDTMRMLLKGYFDDEIIEQKINELKTSGGECETFTAIFRGGQNETESVH